MPITQAPPPKEELKEAPHRLCILLQVLRSRAVTGEPISSAVPDELANILQALFNLEDNIR